MTTATIGIDLPHVWDVAEGPDQPTRPLGVAHEMALDGETLTIREVRLRDGAREPYDVATMPFIDAVHALLNMTPEQRARFAAGPHDDGEDA